MSRLPTPGSDSGTWGTILNDYLSVSLNPDGTLQAIPEAGVINLTSDLAAKYVKPTGGIPKSDLSSSVQTSLSSADSALQSAPVTSVAGKTGAVTLAESDVANLSSDLSGKVSATTLGATNGVATLNGSSQADE